MSEKENPNVGSLWNCEDIAKNASNWNLGSDAKLLNYLETFSEKLLKSCETTHQKLENLSNALDGTRLRLDLERNRFSSLSNSQFIESRIYEEDETATDLTEKEEDEEEEGKPEELSKSDVKQAALIGLSVLERLFDKLQVPESEDSDSDADETCAKFVLRPKDLYMDRPLPFIIGSEEWYESRDCGIKDSSSESEIEVGDDFSDDSTPEIRENVPIQDNLSGNELSDKPEDINSKKIGDENEDFVTTEEHNSVTGQTHNNIGGSTFAEQLAEKLGNVINANEPNSEVNRKPIQKQSRQSNYGRLFSNEPPPIEDEDLFHNTKNSGGLFSGGNGLFDDLEDDVSFWGENNVSNHRTEERKIESNKIENSTQGNDKKVNNLFDESNSSDGEGELFSKKGTFDKNSNVKKEEKSQKINVPETIQKPKKKISLFDDNSSEDDDLFLTKKPIENNSKKKTLSLFDDDDNSKHLFDKKQTESVSNKDDVTNNNYGSRKEKMIKKIPSLFSDSDSDSDDLFSSSFATKIEPKITGNDAEKKKGVLKFDELFSSPKISDGKSNEIPRKKDMIKENVMEDKSKETDLLFNNESKIVGNDEEKKKSVLMFDDLFSSSKISDEESNKIPIKKDMIKDNVMEDESKENDLLFNIESKIAGNDEEKKKRISMFDDIFSSSKISDEKSNKIPIKKNIKENVMKNKSKENDLLFNNESKITGNDEETKKRISMFDDLFSSSKISDEKSNKTPIKKDMIKENVMEDGSKENDLLFNSESKTTGNDEEKKKRISMFDDLFSSSKISDEKSNKIPIQKDMIKDNLMEDESKENDLLFNNESKITGNDEEKKKRISMFDDLFSSPKISDEKSNEISTKKDMIKENVMEDKSKENESKITENDEEKKKRVSMFDDLFSSSKISDEKSNKIAIKKDMVKENVMEDKSKENDLLFNNESKTTGNDEEKKKRISMFDDLFSSSNISDEKSNEIPIKKDMMKENVMEDKSKQNESKITGNDEEKKKEVSTFDDLFSSSKISNEKSDKTPKNQKSLFDSESDDDLFVNPKTDRKIIVNKAVIAKPTSIFDKELKINNLFPSPEPQFQSNDKEEMKKDDASKIDNKDEEIGGKSETTVTKVIEVEENSNFLGYGSPPTDVFDEIPPTKDIFFEDIPPEEPPSLPSVANQPDEDEDDDSDDASLKNSSILSRTRASIFDEEPPDFEVNFEEGATRATGSHWSSETDGNPIGRPKLASPGKLKHNLNINVQALLPGGPSKRGLSKPQRPVSESDIPSPSQYQSIGIPTFNAKSPELKSENIDVGKDLESEPERIEVLSSVTKSRARIPNRRPSTRRGREAFRKSCIDLTTDFSKDDEGLIKEEEVTEEKQPNPKVEVEVRSAVVKGDDFAVPKFEKADLFDSNDDGDDLFSEKRLPPKSSILKKNLFDDDDDDDDDFLQSLSTTKKNTSETKIASVKKATSIAIKKLENIDVTGDDPLNAFDR